MAVGARRFNFDKAFLKPASPMSQRTKSGGAAAKSAGASESGMLGSDRNANLLSEVLKQNTTMDVGPFATVAY